MISQPWTTETQTEPPVSWNADTQSFFIVLNRTREDGSQEKIEAEWKPPVVFAVRCRKKGVSEWGPGFVTPVSSCQFVGLKPDTAYEFQLSAKEGDDERVLQVMESRTMTME